MAYSKKRQFNLDQTRLAEFAKALSHPARVAILQTLAERKACVCGEIVEVLPLAQSTVSQHLKELKEIGLIKGEIDGPRSCYCLDPARLDEMAEMMQQYLDEIQKVVSADKTS